MASTASFSSVGLMSNFNVGHIDAE
jgi:hypothetical protein